MVGEVEVSLSCVATDEVDQLSQLLVD
jgi:hypothetical protein